MKSDEEILDKGRHLRATIYDRQYLDRSKTEKRVALYDERQISDQEVLKLIYAGERKSDYVIYMSAQQFLGVFGDKK